MTHLRPYLRSARYTPPLDNGNSCGYNNEPEPLFVYEVYKCLCTSFWKEYLNDGEREWDQVQLRPSTWPKFCIGPWLGCEIQSFKRGKFMFPTSSNGQSIRDDLNVEIDLHGDRLDQVSVT